MKYIFGALGVIGIIILFVVFIVNGDDSNTPAQNAAETPMQLVDYAKKPSSVSVTSYGKLVGDTEYRSIRVTVSPNERRVEVLAGYNEAVVSSNTYQNTPLAYENFLSALSAQGFLRSKNTNITDERGACPTGNRYAYALRENGKDVSRLWIATCDGVGTFAGRSATDRKSVV